VIQINFNLSGSKQRIIDNPPILLNDDGVQKYTMNLDADNPYRGNFQLPDKIQANGWNLTWLDNLIRPWLSTSPTHEPLLSGWIGEAGQLNPPIPVLDYPIALEQPQVSGIDFITSSGRFLFKGATNYLALARHLIGQEPASYAGANVDCVLLTAHNITSQQGLPDLRPENYSGYFNGLHDLGIWLNERGRLLYAICLADMQFISSDYNWMSNFIRDCANAMQGVVGFFSIGNEFWNNGFDPNKLSRPSINIPCCHGSIADEAGSNGYDGMSHWDFLDIHIRRDYPKMLAHCQVAEPQLTYQKPIISGEPFKANEQPEFNKSYTDPRIFFQGGRTMSAYNGGVFHSFCGVYSIPLSPVQDACRQAFFLGCVE